MIGVIVDATTVFQRTESGRDTIKNKTYKLTQSERLLLIVIDGVTSYEGLRKEVWALTQERFDRALDTLLNAGLVLEVLFRVMEQKAELLDKVEVERFLKQDPMDPVTIISAYPEEDFGVGKVSTSAPVADTNAMLASSAPAVVPGLQSSASNAASPAQAASASTSTASVSTPEFSVPKLAGIPASVNANDPWPSLVLSPASTLLPDQTPQAAADDWPDEWPEFLMEKPRRKNHMQWVAWAALGGGVLIILLSIYFQIRR